MSFTSMHNDYLDHDKYHSNDRIDGGDYDQPEKAWHLYQIQPGQKTLIGVYRTSDGADAMGCDMNEWMVENEYYGDHAPDDYNWDGDRDYVAIMAKREWMPEFGFEWKEVVPET